MERRKVTVEEIISKVSGLLVYSHELPFYNEYFITPANCLDDIPVKFPISQGGIWFRNNFFELDNISITGCDIFLDNAKLHVTGNSILTSNTITYRPTADINIFGTNALITGHNNAMIQGCTIHGDLDVFKRLEEILIPIE